VEKWRVKTERILTLAIMLDVAHKFCSCGTRTVPTLLAACLSWPLGYYACHTLTLLIIIYSPLSFVFLTIKHISPNCCHVSDMSHTLTLLGHTSNYIYSVYIPLTRLGHVPRERTAAYVWFAVRRTNNLDT
jgi:hypothetical protein